MEWNIPGTALRMTLRQSEEFRPQLESVFMMGGVSLGQIVTLTGLEPYQIQNWVRRGYLAPPENKRYTLRQLCRILNINLMKNTLTMESICSLLSFVNGRLDDEGDDLIDDTLLYFYFVRLAARAQDLGNKDVWDVALKEVTASYREPIPGAGEKLEKVLKVMLTAWLAGRLKAQAEQMLSELSI